MDNKTGAKIVANLRANGLMYFALVTIVYMIYNVIMTYKESYCSSCSGGCECEKCNQTEYFSEYLGGKDSTGFISTNIKKCNQPVFRYGIPGAATKQRVPYL